MPLWTLLLLGWSLELQIAASGPIRFDGPLVLTDGAIWDAGRLIERVDGRPFTRALRWADGRLHTPARVISTAEPLWADDRVALTADANVDLKSGRVTPLGVVRRAVSPNGRYELVEERGEGLVREVRNRRRLYGIAVGRPRLVDDAGQAWGAEGAWILRWSADRVEPKRFADHPPAIDALVLDPSGASLLTVSAGRTEVKIWSLETGQARPLLGVPAVEPGRIAFSPDGRTLAFGVKGEVLLFDARSGRATGRLSGTPPGPPITAVSAGPSGIAFTAGRTVLLSTGEFLERGACEFASCGGEPIVGKPKRVDRTLGAIAGKLAVEVGGRPVWLDPKTGKPLGAIDGALAAVTKESALLIGSSDTVLLWDAARMRPLGAIASFPDGWLFARVDGRWSASDPKLGVRALVAGERGPAPLAESLFDLKAGAGLFDAALEPRELGPPPSVQIVQPSEPITTRGETLEVLVQVTDEGGGVARVHLERDGEAVEERPTNTRQAGRISGRLFNVRLRPGANVLTAWATSSDGLAGPKVSQTAQRE